MSAELPADTIGLTQLPPALPKFIDKSTLPVAAERGLLKRIQLRPALILPLKALLAVQLPVMRSAVRKESAPMLVSDSVP